MANFPGERFAALITESHSEWRQWGPNIGGRHGNSKRTHIANAPVSFLDC